MISSFCLLTYLCVTVYLLSWYLVLILLSFVNFVKWFHCFLGINTYSDGSKWEDKHSVA